MARIDPSNRRYWHSTCYFCTRSRVLTYGYTLSTAERGDPRGRLIYPPLFSHSAPDTRFCEGFRRCRYGVYRTYQNPQYQRDWGLHCLHTYTADGSNRSAYYPSTNSNRI